MDAFLKNTFVQIGGVPYELVSEQTVGTATTNVDFTGLSFGKEDDLLLVGDIRNASGSASVGYRLTFNANHTLTNYYSQMILADTTVIASSRSNLPNLAGGDNNQNLLGITNIKLTNNGYIVYQNSTNRAYNATVTYLQNINGTSTFTATSITDIRILATVTNAISVGSRFQLYKRVAPIIADIIVSTATTSVDFTGLEIDKDSEYMLVSTIVNGTVSGSNFAIYANTNFTSTNYYRQQLQADSTSVTASRVNDASSLYSNASKNSFSISNIKLTNNGYFVTQNSINTDISASSTQLFNRYTTSTFTLTSITALRVTASVTNAIGIGSRFQLIKIK
jgi:hypothetical protein